MKRSFPLSVDRLEDRCVPAAKLFGSAGLVPPPVHSGPIVVQLDGPVVSAHSRIEISMHPAALREQIRSWAGSDSHGRGRSSEVEFHQRGRSSEAAELHENRRDRHDRKDSKPDRDRNDDGDSDGTSFVIDVFPVDPNLPELPAPPTTGGTVPDSTPPPSDSTNPPIGPPIPPPSV